MGNLKLETHSFSAAQEEKSNQSERKGPEFDHSSDSSKETGIKDFFSHVNIT